MKVKLLFMVMLLALSIVFGVYTYHGVITGRQIIWIIVIMCDWIYLDYYFNVKEVSHEDE